MSDLALTAIPNVSAPCVTTNPCTCPVYGPGGVYMPVTAPDGSWYCALALEVGPTTVPPAPVPSLSSVGLGVLFVALAFVGAWRIR